MKKRQDAAGSNPAETVQADNPVEVSQELEGVPEQEQHEEVPDDESAETEALRQLLDEKERELQETSQKYLRLAAEYDNFRKRTQKEKEALYADSITLVVKEWLPVLDNLDRAAQLIEQSQDTGKIAEGLSMVRKQAFEVMEKLGVNEIECLNAEFDPNLHDAVMHVEDDNYGSSTVVEVLQKGYQRGDNVIRHSIVKVAN